MKVFVLGGTGMLGHKLVQRWSGRFQLATSIRGDRTTLDRYPFYGDAEVFERVDAMDWSSVAQAVRRAKPTVMVNCIGVIKQDARAKDPVACLTLNSLLPHQLAALAGDLGARLIQISTDCVFRGDRGNYADDEPFDALDLYGRSKAMGEVDGTSALTVRTSIIGRELTVGSGLLEWAIAQREGEISGYTGAFFSGFSTQELARILGEVICDHPKLYGVRNVSANAISKYELLGLINDAFDLKMKIRPDPTVMLDRTLDSSKFRSETGYVPPSWPEMVAELRRDPTRYDAWR